VTRFKRKKKHPVLEMIIGKM